MGLNHGTNIVNDGLVFLVDPINPRSWTGPNSSNVNDLSSNTTGSIVNNTSGSYGVNKSFIFDGTDDRINLANSIDLGLNNTTSMWVNLDSSYNDILLGEDSYTYDYFIYVRVSSPGFFVRIAAVYVNFTDAITYLTAESWHNLAIVRSGDSAEVFIDGISRGTNTGLGTSTNTKFDTIGAKTDGSLPTSGKISHIKAYNKILSAQEVKQNYNALKGRFQ